MAQPASALSKVKLLIVGGGSAGLGIASKMTKRLGKQAIAVVEGHETHFYQPGFTLVGGGLMHLRDLRRTEKLLIPPNVQLVKNFVSKFDPDNNRVVLLDGQQVEYEYMVVTTGLQIRLDMVEGLSVALSSEDVPVSTIYLPQYAEKTHRYLSTIKGGELLFTFPNTPVKCAGAPQKICYIADDILRSRGVREAANLHYYTSLPKIFGVEKYAKALMKIIEERRINLHTRHNLVKVDGLKRLATFEDLDNPGKTIEKNFDFLHVGPPCSSIAALRENKNALTDQAGWVDVHPQTLQSRSYSNVFALGDCANSPNAKTAAAISSQLKVVERNLSDVIEGRQGNAQYDGYASCPLVVSRNKVILAEFNGAGPLETFPFDQSRPTRFAFFLKRYFMPFLYWHGLIKGRWNGPATARRILHIGSKN